MASTAPSRGDGSKRRSGSSSHHRSGGSKRGSSSGGAGGLAADLRKGNPLWMKSDFICRYKCTNALPDVPQDPKLLQYPFDPMRYVRRGPGGSALEKAYSQAAPILSEPDLGVPIDLIDPDQYTVTGEEPQLHELDLELIEGQASLEERKVERGAPMPWFLATYYVDPLAAKEYRGELNSKLEDDNMLLSPSVQRAVQNEDSVDARIGIVEDSFAEAAAMVPGQLQHPQKKGVSAVEVTPLLPDVDRWGIDLVHAAFDEPPPQVLPARQSKDGATIVQGGRPIIQGLASENEQWMAYLVPTTAKRKADGVDVDEPADERKATEYRRLRSYTFANVADTEEKKKEAGKTNLIYRPGGTGPYLYKNLEDYFRLKKRVRTDETDETAADRDSLLVLRHDPTEEDIEAAAEKRQGIDDDQDDDFGDLGEEADDAGESAESVKEEPAGELEQEQHAQVTAADDGDDL